MTEYRRGVENQVWQTVLALQSALRALPARVIRNPKGQTPPFQLCDVCVTVDRG